MIGTENNDKNNECNLTNILQIDGNGYWNLKYSLIYWYLIIFMFLRRYSHFDFQGRLFNYLHAIELETTLTEKSIYAITICN